MNNNAHLIVLSSRERCVFISNFSNSKQQIGESSLENYTICEQMLVTIHEFELHLI